MAGGAKPPPAEPFFMKIIINRKITKPFVSVVCCLHGNEKFGLRIFNALKKQINRYPGLQLIVANEEAIKINKRFVDQDLNRSFPGRPQGNHETKLAYKILKKVFQSDYVLDIHTTVSAAGFLTPIFAKQNKNTQRIINLLPEEKIVMVRQPLANLSLIGNVKNGVSLEFGKKEAKGKPAVKTVMELIENLYAGQTNRPRQRQIFCVNGVIPKETKLPTKAKNFQLVKKYKFYPVLLKDASYIGNQGLKANKKIQKLI
jgi:succinylglutamate desuccinylase